MDVDTPPLDGRLAICLGGGSTVLKDCVAAVEAARRDRLEALIEAALPDWSPPPVARACRP